MNPVTLNVSVSGLDEANMELRGVIAGLSSRRDLNMELARVAVAMTQAHLIEKRTEHTTAQRLGAQPSGFRRKNAAALQAEWDDEAGIIVIPRNTGLGQAFGDVVINPTNGRKFLTIPACAETYGQQAGEFPEDTFDFAIILTKRGPAPVFLWARTEGQHEKGEVAFWLRRTVTKKQDRGLLPADDEYRELGRRVAAAYIVNLTSRQPSA